MTKPNQHKNWLNVVIITISGLILAFTLLGKFFDSGLPTESMTDSPQVHQFELIKIDFGQLQLHKSSDSWISQPIGSLEQTQIDLIASQWDLLLTKEIQKNSVSGEFSVQSASTVLLYLRGESRPIICKVVIASKLAFVEFLASGQKVEVTTGFAESLLPNKSALLNHTDKNTDTTDESNNA